MYSTLDGSRVLFAVMFEEEGENHVFPVAAVGDQSKVRERPLRRTHLEGRGWEGREGRKEGHEEGEWEEGERGKGREGREGEDLFDPESSVQHYTCQSSPYAFSRWFCTI